MVTFASRQHGAAKGGWRDENVDNPAAPGQELSVPENFYCRALILVFVYV